MTELSHLLTLPDEWQWGEFKNNNGQKIRYGMNYPDHAKAMVVIAEGRTECIEEYFETIRDMNDQGYACAIMDWQGQGMSYRYNNDNTRHHSEGFEQDMADFDLFLQHLPTKLPKILFAHSMGAAITLRYSAEHPTVFQCAYLVAPMLGLRPKFAVQHLSKPIFRVVQKLNALNKYAFGQTRWNDHIANIAKYKVSSDPVRRELQPHLFKTRPNLQTGGVTFGWLKEALKSIALLQTNDVCSKITFPVFMALAGRDVVVDNNGAYETASMLEHCNTHVFKKAEHQIHRENDDIRNDVMSSFYSFAEKYLSR